MKKPRRIRAWAVVLWLLVWQLGSMAISNQILLVSPLAVFVRLFSLVQTGEFWSSIAFSLLRIAGGFFLGVFIGILLAALSSRFVRVRELIDPLMLTIKTVPVASFIILALIWFSSRSLSVLISFLMVLPVIYHNVLMGIQSMDPHLDEMAQVFRIPPGRKLRYLSIPQILPFFYAGASIALGLSWKAGVAAEVIGVPSGSIGAHLQQAKIYLDTPDMFAWTLVIVAVSVLFEKSVLALLTIGERRLERMP